MIQSRITSKAQTTVPRAVRKALGLSEGDDLAWMVKDGKAIVTRVLANDDTYVNNFSTFTEWADELDDVYDNL